MPIIIRKRGESGFVLPLVAELQAGIIDGHMLNVMILNTAVHRAVQLDDHMGAAELT